MLDDCKIDLMGIPFLVQAKKGYDNRRPKFEQEYIAMKEAIERNFHPEHPIHRLPYLLIHELSGTSGKKKPVESTFVQLTLDDFIKLITEGVPKEILHV